MASSAPLPYTAAVQLQRQTDALQTEVQELRSRLHHLGEDATRTEAHARRSLLRYVRLWVPRVSGERKQGVASDSAQGGNAGQPQNSGR